MIKMTFILKKKQKHQNLSSYIIKKNSSKLGYRDSNCSIMPLPISPRQIKKNDIQTYLPLPPLPNSLNIYDENNNGNIKFFLKYSRKNFKKI